MMSMKAAAAAVAAGRSSGGSVRSFISIKSSFLSRKWNSIIITTPIPTSQSLSLSQSQRKCTSQLITSKKRWNSNSNSNSIKSDSSSSSGSSSSSSSSNGSSNSTQQVGKNGQQQQQQQYQTYDEYVNDVNATMQSYNRARLLMQQGKLKKINNTEYNSSSKSMVYIQVGIVATFVSIFYFSALLGKKIARDKEFRTQYIPNWMYPMKDIDYDSSLTLTTETESDIDTNISGSMEMHEQNVLAMKHYHERAIAGDFTPDKLLYMHKTGKLTIDPKIDTTFKPDPTITIQQVQALTGSSNQYRSNNTNNGWDQFSTMDDDDDDE